MSPTSPFNDTTRPDTTETELIIEHGAGGHVVFSGVQVGKSTYQTIQDRKQGRGNPLIHLECTSPRTGEVKPVNLDCRTVTFLWLKPQEPPHNHDD